DPAPGRPVVGRTRPRSPPAAISPKETRRAPPNRGAALVFGFPRSPRRPLAPISPQETWRAHPIGVSSLILDARLPPGVTGRGTATAAPRKASDGEGAGNGTTGRRAGHGQGADGGDGECRVSRGGAHVVPL